jgi:hypothetical protein
VPELQVYWDFACFTFYSKELRLSGSLLLGVIFVNRFLKFIFGDYFLVLCMDYI